ncbi:peptidoglycan-binding domain-containing protein [Pseudovibrio sp. SPO723]|uniref:peptidoglycan-binding domain-containing protein n=1 Tax=Nesiotobacter zosterae TaxID=392721 RepID=UPI0029C20984|nr:peptidoglycan-binding domain-containing protein [Pseudovibrio sp. SPO723]MDX5594426.1 peptidoglycan-binding domain-containing protein [Pseudovibrio sp. SPO723]
MTGLKANHLALSMLLALVTSAEAAQKADRLIPEPEAGRGAIFCDARVFGADAAKEGATLCSAEVTEDCVSPLETDATFILGEPEENARSFGYDIWFENGLNCSVLGEMNKAEDGIWRYDDLACKFQLSEDENGIRFRSASGEACVSGCGADVGVGAIVDSWTNSRFQHAPTLKTYEDLGLCTPSAPPSSPFTEEGLRIFAAQRILKHLGYEVGPVDGKLGPMTREALEKYAALEDVAFEGEVSEELLNLLDTAERALAKEKEGSPGPDEMLATIYGEEEPKTEVFDEPLRKSWFTPRVLNLIAYAEQRGDLLYGAPGLFFNPIVPGNDIQISNLRLTPAQIDGDTAVVEVFFQNFDSRYALRYELKKLPFGWRINDIVTPTGSLQDTLKGI